MHGSLLLRNITTTSDSHASLLLTINNFTYCDFQATLMVKRCPNQIADELSMSTTNLQTMKTSNSQNILQETALNALNMDYNKKLKHHSTSKPDCMYYFIH